jgi:hypothetical protein
MKHTLLIAGIMVIGSCSVALAQSQADMNAMFTKEYASCMGGAADQQDTQRASYCHCVVDGMRGWDSATLSSALDEQTKSGSTSQLSSAKIEALAQSCISKTLK